VLSTLQTLEAYSGDTTTFAVAVTDGGVAHDLTGRTLSWLVSATRDGATLLVKDVTVHSNAAAGLSALTLTPEDIETIGGPGSYILTGIEVDGTAEVTRAVSNLRIRGRPQRA
jgi:hypothetical protein